MSDSTTKECVINGVQFQCRTCFDPGSQIFSITDKYNSTKTWLQLLNDIAQLKINNEELLPKTICCKCVEKLSSYYNFQLQIENVNNKYSEMLTSLSNTIQENMPPHFECLAESANVLPLVTEIKLEDECVIPFDIALESSNFGSLPAMNKERNELENEEACDPFEKLEVNLENQQSDRYLDEDTENEYTRALNENSSSSSEYLPEKNRKKDESCKNTRYSSNQLPKIACEHSGKAFDCTSLNQQDIQNFHKIFYAKQSKAEQDAFLLKYCSMSSIQRRGPKKSDRCTKIFQTKCYVRTNEGKRLVPVCQKTFLAVLCLKRRRLNYVTKIFHEQGVLPIEKRGGDHRSHKFEMKRTAVKNFLSSVKCIESHYCRERKRRRIYFSNVSTVNELWAMYNENSPNELKVKLDYFRSIFNSKYNLGFKLPKIDACSICSGLSEKIKKCLNENLKEAYIEQKRIHTLKYKEFYAFLKDENPEIFILSFACQKNQLLPKLSGQDSYYKKQLYLQNVTLVQSPSTAELSRNNVFIYTWTDNQYLKNANLVASAVYHRLQCIHFKDNITTLRLFADGCGGQDKKFIMIAMLSKWFLEAPLKLEKIELMFPIIGHSTLPADLVFRKAEQQIKKIKTILLPDEYEKVLSAFGTVLKLLDTCPVKDWKGAGKEFLLPPESWHIKLSTIKKIYFKKQSDGKIVITGEENYRTHFNENYYRNICKENFDLKTMQPALVQPYSVRISCQKIRDIDNMMKIHFGEDWKNYENLKYYTDFINNSKQQEDDNEPEDEYCSQPIEEAPLLNI